MGHRIGVDQSIAFPECVRFTYQRDTGADVLLRLAMLFEQPYHCGSDASKDCHGSHLRLAECFLLSTARHD